MQIRDLMKLATIQFGALAKMIENKNEDASFILLQSIPDTEKENSLEVVAAGIGKDLLQMVGQMTKATPSLAAVILLAIVNEMEKDDALGDKIKSTCRDIDRSLVEEKKSQEFADELIASILKKPNGG